MKKQLTDFIFSRKGKITFKENYYITDNGKIFKDNKQLKNSVNKSGYEVINIKDKNNKSHTAYIHHLVYYHFIDKNYFITKDRNLQLDHINQNELDNSKSNLRAITICENLLNRRPRRSGYLTEKTKIKNLKKARDDLFNEIDRLIDYFK